MKIDFVLPWVDGNNEKWLEIRKKYEPKLKDNDSFSSARFRDMGTLKYVLRSIEKNCPWYNKIYIITKGYYPNWLNINHPKIKLVTEDELFINKEHLPVFNSIAIEMNLANLKGLSEKFIYLNDDMIIRRALQPNRFFMDDLPVDFFVHGWIPRNRFFDLIKKRDVWIYTINNTLKLINKKFAPVKLDKRHLYHNSYSLKDKFSNFLLSKIYKKCLWIEHWHHPQPHKKSTLDEVYNTFKKEMLKSSSNRFRDKSDLNPYIYRYWQLLKGEFYPYKHNDGAIANLNSLTTLNKLINKVETNNNIKFVCFNDSILLDDKEYEQVKKTLLAYLEKVFSKKASFEN